METYLPTFVLAGRARVYYFFPWGESSGPSELTSLLISLPTPPAEASVGHCWLCIPCAILASELFQHYSYFWLHLAFPSVYAICSLPTE